jgi:hypothetical protein
VQFNMMCTSPRVQGVHSLLTCALIQHIKQNVDSSVVLEMYIY